MANENCLANTSADNTFALTPYGTFTNVYTRAISCLSYGLVGSNATARDEGMNGTPWRQKGSEVLVSSRASGPIVHNPRIDELQHLIPLLMGGTFVLDVLTPTKICDFFSTGNKDVLTDRILDYIKCVVATWEISASDSSPFLQLTMNVEAAEEQIRTGVGGWPVGLALSVLQPLVFRQGTLELGFAGGLEAAYRMKSVTLRGDNGIQADDFFNSLTREDMPSAFQDFFVVPEIPWDSGDLVDLTADAQEASATIEFQQGTSILRFEYPDLFVAPSNPAISGRSRTLNTLEFAAQVDAAGAGYPVRVTVTV